MTDAPATGASPEATSTPTVSSAAIPSSAAAAPSPSLAPAVTAEPSQAELPLANEAQPSSSAETPVAAEAPAAEAEALAVEAKPEQTAETPAEGEAGEPEKQAPATPTYAEFKIPDGVTAPADVMGAYTNILGKYNLPQEAGQELLDFHASQIKSAQTAMAENQVRVFDDTQRKWRASVDKEFGNQRDTVLNDAKSVISQYAGNKKQLREVWDVLAFTGAGNHPSVIRLFRNIHRAFGEGQAPLPAPATGTQGLSAADRRYGRKN